MQKLIDKNIIVKDFKFENSKFEGKDKRVDIQIEYREEPRLIMTDAKYIIQLLERITKDNLPFSTTIIKNGEHYEFA